MAAPTWVQSHAGTVITAASGTIGTLAGVTVGNFIVLQILQDGTGGLNITDTNNSVENLVGTDNTMDLAEETAFQVGAAVAVQWVFLGRALTTSVSMDMTITGDDIYCQIHEFANVNTGTTQASVFENTTAGNADNGTGAVAQVDDTAVTTLGVDRLAVNFIGVNDDNQASFSSFTGETGGDWVQRATFGSATGTDGAVGLQTAAMASAGTINGGSFTMAAADPWGVVGFALIGTTPTTLPPETRKTWPALQAVNRAGTF